MTLTRARHRRYMSVYPCNVSRELAVLPHGANFRRSIKNLETEKLSQILWDSDFRSSKVRSDMLFTLRFSSQQLSHSTHSDCSVVTEILFTRQAVLRNRNLPVFVFSQVLATRRHFSFFSVVFRWYNNKIGF